MATHYAFAYAVISDLTNGKCLQELDSTDYILDPRYIPVDEIVGKYLLKYYWPLPSSPVTSFDDFQGKWYIDAAHTQEATELNG